MAQRIFDVENEEDMRYLWDILPDNIVKIVKDITSEGNPYNRYYTKDYCYGGFPLININWHDKTEITRPIQIQEATETDIGKLCKFWDDSENKSSYGILQQIETERGDFKYLKLNFIYKHCRRLTKQEIEELC